MKLGGEIIYFLLDSGATHSVITDCKGPLSKTKVLITGATGKWTLRPFLQAMYCEIGGKVLTQQFLYMLECPEVRNRCLRVNCRTIVDLDKSPNADFASFS